MADEFKKAGEVFLADVLEALQKQAEEIMLVADNLVPKDTETLRESARIFPPNMDPSPGITFGYGFGGTINPKTGNAVDTYTVPVHEILEAKHEPPTQAKFLEEPLFASLTGFQAKLTAELRILWGRETAEALFGGGLARRLSSGRFAPPGGELIRAGQVTRAET